MADLKFKMAEGADSFQTDNVLAANPPPVAADPPVPESQKTSDVYRTLTDLPERFNDPSILRGYEKVKAPHPVYQTSNSSYGGKPPSIHTMPNQFHGRGNKFTSNLAGAGNYTYCGLNTALDKSVV